MFCSSNYIHFCFCFCFYIMAVGQIAMDCCLEVKNKVVPKEVVVHYFEQVGGQGCDIDATILVTRQGRNLCITPTQPKLNQIKKHVDKLKNHCKKTDKGSIKKISKYLTP
uniref:Chemokine interleukin-8-like domain-containing protein n=1 Tax=Periophthalmus magnuspinnatus TaxID=409849 RepID=A0A3B3ZQJ8_9GOBI